MGRYVRSRELARYEQAEEVCYTLLLAMGLGILPAKRLSQGSRDFLAEPMLAWMDLREEEK